MFNSACARRVWCLLLGVVFSLNHDAAVERLLSEEHEPHQVQALVFLQREAHVLTAEEPEVAVWNTTGAVAPRILSLSGPHPPKEGAQNSTAGGIQGLFHQLPGGWWLPLANVTRTPLLEDNLASFAIVLLPVVIILVLVGIVVVAIKSDDIRYDPGRHSYARVGRRRQYGSAMPPVKAAQIPPPHPEFEEYATRASRLPQAKGPVTSSGSRPGSAMQQGSNQPQQPPPYARFQMAHSYPDPRDQGGTSPVLQQVGPAVPAQPRRAQREMVLCKQLVLPHCEAWFAVPWLRLMHGPDFDLFGISGRPLLRGDVRLAAGGHRTLALSMTPTASPELGSIANDAGSGALTVRNGEEDIFGVLTFVRVGNWTLKTDAGDLLHLNVNELTGEVVLREGSSPRLCAEAARCMESEFFGQGDHLEMRLEPGTDSVLIVLCILGVILFGSPNPNPLPLTGPLGQVAFGGMSD